MLQEKEQQSAQSNLYDSDSVYGWISILLHWVTAIVIIVLWFIGKSIMIAPIEDADTQRQLHVSIAASAWLFILIRIVWRFRSSHPHIKGQALLIHRIAKSVHYTMLIAVALMLASGPVMVWSGGNPIAFFSWFSIASPIGESETIREFAWFIHSNSALLLLCLVLLHVGGALKHLMFHTDDTIVRMIWPGTQKSGADV
jgi:cytochrome b561